MTRRMLHQIDVSVSRKTGIRRRDFLRGVSAGALATGLLNWTDILNVSACEMRKNGMACILLWMQGGPSQFETFDPKPGHRNGGQTLAIDTTIPGVQLAENLPNLAKAMEDVCLIRSMNGREGSHPRASYLMHTGYIPTASIKHPSLGANVVNQIGDQQNDLPRFVRIGDGRFGGGGGFLGVDYDPFVVSKPEQVPANTEIQTSKARFRQRLRLLDRLENQYEKAGGQDIVADHKSLYDRAAKMILSPKMEVFDVSREKENVRRAYGDSDFASGCLLARRLIEAGVTFVEVTLNGWDTHDDNFNRSTNLCLQMDRPYAQLLSDLKDRGMLERTLVICMGEFGRTPRINGRAGRDHYPRAFSLALSGTGVRGGQVIGRTDAGGNDIADRPVTVEDFFCTVFHALQIDPRHENYSNIGRPIKLVEGGQVVREVFA